MREELYQCTKCGEYKASRVLTECDDCIEKQFELERLADIGRATEKAYKEDILLCEVMPGYEYNEREVMFKTVEELLEWAKGGK